MGRLTKRDEEGPLGEGKGLDLDFVLAGLAGLVALAVVVVLVADIQLFVQEPLRARDRQLAAQLSQVERKVRRRPHDAPVWMPSGSGDDLYLNDSLFTDAGSTATLTFATGETIELGENTLIALETVEERPVLNVIKGAVRVQSSALGGAVAIRVAGREPLIRPGPGAEVQVQVEPGAPAAVQVLKGDSQVGGTWVGTSQAVILAREGGPSPPRHLALALRFPDHGARLQSGQAARFAWDAPPATRAILEVSLEPSFAQVWLQVETGDAYHEVKGLPVGSYYWRVRRVGEQATLGEVRRLQVLEQALPHPLAPPTRSPAAEELPPPEMPERFEIELPYHRDGSGLRRLWDWLKAVVEETALAKEEEKRPSSRCIDWPPVAGAVGYRLEVASDPSFSRVVHREDVNQPESHLAGLVAGTYWLRVASRSQGGRLGPFSKPTQLLLRPKNQNGEAPTLPAAASPASERASGLAKERGPPALLPPPLALRPRPDETIVSMGRMPVVSFAWQPVAGATSYDLQVRESGAAGQVVHQERTRGLDANVPLAEGSYVWSLRAVRQPSAGVGPWSAPWRFQLKIATLKTAAPKGAVPPKNASSQDPPPNPTRKEPPPTSSQPPAGSAWVAWSPGAYRYESTNQRPTTRIKALLFNGVRGGGQGRLGEWLGWLVDFNRTSTVIFRQRESGDPEGQGALPMQLHGFGVGPLARLGGGSSEGMPWFEGWVGYQRQAMAHFQRSLDGTLALTPVVTEGAGVGLGVGWQSGTGLRLGGRLDWGWARPGQKLASGQRRQIRLDGWRPALAPGLMLGGGYGYALEEARFKVLAMPETDHLRIAVHTLHGGIGFSW